MILDFNFIEKVIGLQDITVKNIEVNEGEIFIYAESKFKIAICPKCKKITTNIHDSRSQPIKHLPFCDKETVIHLTVRRYCCDCDKDHPFTEELESVRYYQRQTVAIEKQVYDLCKKNTIKNVAILTGFSEKKVQKIFNHYASIELDNRDNTPSKYLGIDDIAIRKGHNYVTVIYDQEKKRIIDIIDGRTKDGVTEALKTIFSIEERSKIEAVSIDMSKSYAGAVAAVFPNAYTVIDRFHIAQQFYNRLDDARKHIQNKIRKEENNKKKVFKIRWSLLKNFDDLSADELKHLLDVCAEYPMLLKCLELKEEFKKFFDIYVIEEADAFIDHFQLLIEESGIEELKSFSNTLDNWRDKILNYYEHPITNGFVEGMNHKVKNIKRRAYNYRNMDNFKTRVKQECS